eukprot:CAMPEP_0172552212 /NCGR_PEP_ID=MMETSP1067-20121228/43690_1 /TAXON_ID=265564 ORGANISM="Thalassiosira punctigera, Strain Tpunct2005C2" /NCGR_SAMPLE_ID=MMETSP1067 /ASSEMBLY_ACC=CAM_ASM_000444 /LENGTH=248 /DNA_ID=CAMNT_0013340139 /DNA_START=77 /DNA_END=823 /DNA_ORIENTATION=-
MTSASLLLLMACLLQSAHSFSTTFHVLGRTAPSSLSVKNKWDMLIDEDEDEDLQFDGPPVPRDMKYNMFNIDRQRTNFESIKAVAGKDLTNDVYARNPETDTFWFIGKVAHVSDVSVEKAVARQWAMVEEHSARLRPAELYPKWGSLQLWVAPGDSELDVAYCKPEIKFVQMFRDVGGASEVRNIEVGFQGELYENDEEGFRTIRTNDGEPVKSEIQSSADRRQPTDAELDDMMEVLNSQVLTNDDNE